MLAGLLLILQYQLWVGNGSIAEIWQLNKAIAAQQQENARLAERNAALDAEVQDLKHGLDAVEERARADLGMIRQNESFYQIIEDR